MGDFTGFTFGNVHSSEVGIIRVSGGDRYEEELHPEIKDRTAEVPGLDGEYFFGSDYGTRKFDLEFAYDSLTEEQFRKLRTFFSGKQPKELIFDDRPYKKYIAKLESPVELSFVCFDEPKKRIVGTDENDKRYGVRVSQRTPITETVVDEETQEETEVVVGYDIERERIYPYELEEGTQRIYKGEGKVSFVCHFPFAKSVYKVLPNKGSEEWAFSSGLLTENDYKKYDEYDAETGIIKVYNAGDVNTGFRLYLPGDTLSNTITLTYKQDEAVEMSDILVLNPITLKVNGKDEENHDVLDCGVLIDTNNGLIVGIKPQTIMENGQKKQVPFVGDNNATYYTSNNLYNEFVNSGYFFKLQPNDIGDNATLQIEGGGEGIRIFYDYLYF